MVEITLEPITGLSADDYALDLSDSSTQGQAAAARKAAQFYTDAAPRSMCGRRSERWNAVARSMVDSCCRGDSVSRPHTERVMKTIESIDVVWRDLKRRSGRPCIIGRSLKVKYVAQWREGNDKLNPQDIAEYYGLSLPQVHSALAYYYLHKAEIDSEFEEDRIYSEKLDTLGEEAAQDWYLSRPIPANGLPKDAPPRTESINLIYNDPEVQDGRPCILGSDRSVAEIVMRQQSGKIDDDETAAYFEIGLAQVHAAMAYYYLHQAAIDADIAAMSTGLEQERLV